MKRNLCLTMSHPDSHSPAMNLQSDFDVIALRNPSEMRVIVNSRIVLTGASGFVGKWIIGGWLSAKKTYGGCGQLLITSRNPHGLLDMFPELQTRSDVIMHPADIREFNIDPRFQPDIVIHGATAASDSLNRSNPREMISVIVDGTRQVLKAAKQARAKKIAFLSSGAVYGQNHPLGTNLREDDLCAPRLNDSGSAYHEAKRLAELLCNLERHEGHLQTVNLRLFTFLAPFLPLGTHFAAGNFVRSALRNEPLVIRSGGGSVRSYMYGSDLASSILISIAKPLKFTEYNIGSSEGISIRDLALRVQEIVNPRSEIVVQGRDTESTLTTYVPDVTRAQDEIQFGSRVELDATIEKTAMWYRNH